MEERKTRRFRPSTVRSTPYEYQNLLLWNVSERLLRGPNSAPNSVASNDERKEERKKGRNSVGACGFTSAEQVGIFHGESAERRAAEIFLRRRPYASRNITR